MIRVLFFAKLREELDCPQLELDLPDGSTVESLRAKILTDYPGWKEALCDVNVIIALNHEVVDLDAIVTPGDEVAFYPPVTGG